MVTESSPARLSGTFAIRQCFSRIETDSRRRDIGLSGLGGVMDHAEEAVGQLVVAGSDGTVDLEVAEYSLDAVALLI